MTKVREKREIGIQMKIFGLFLAVMVVIIGVISITFLKVAESTIKAEVGESRIGVLTQISRNIDNIIHEVIALSELYYYNDELQTILREPNQTDPYESILEERRAVGIMNKYGQSFANLRMHSVVFSFQGKTFSSWISDWFQTERMQRQDWYDKVLEQNGKIEWISTYNDIDNYRGDKFVFSAARLLKEAKSGRPLGMLMLNIDEDMLHNTYRSGMRNNLYIVDAAGNIVSHPDKSWLGRSVVPSNAAASDILAYTAKYGNVVDNERRMFITYYKLPSVNWTMIEEIPLDQLVPQFSKIQYIVLPVVAFTLIAGLILSFLISTHVAVPIKQLYRHMREVQRGRLDVVSTVQSRDEIGKLSRGFNAMIEKIGELMQDVRREEELKRRAELGFLQAQIKPHFVFNTLYCIKCAVAMKQNDNAERMLMALMGMLNRMFGDRKESVTVAEEMDSLNNYITIQSFRYPDKFAIKLRIDEGTLDQHIPKFMLQPLIENAIFHGIEPKEGAGTITITAVKQRSDTVWTVEDDGVGMSAEQLERIWREADRQGADAFAGVGIVNVHQRLVHLFGEQYGIEVVSAVNKGTCITIRIPEKRPEGGDGRA